MDAVKLEAIELPQGAMGRPDYGGACISNIVPAFLEHRGLGEGWIPDDVLDAEQVVVLLIDGLGWNQLAERTHLAPVLAASQGQAITSVAPTTTAAGLASVTTGAAPGEHGLVGYRIRIGGETLNALRWATENGDARTRIIPTDVQALTPFGSRDPVTVNKSEFVRSGFTAAHLGATRFRGYGTTAILVHEVADAIRSGERFVYAYYDGLDRVGHERGHEAAFDAEFAFVDRLVADVRAALPASVALVVTADHGQVDCRGGLEAIDPAVMSSVRAVSGEARFVWLHARPGAQADLVETARACYDQRAWVLSCDEVIGAQLLGSRVTPDARSRLGDVAVITQGTLALADPSAPESILIGRHGSLTADELYVPLLCPR